MFYIQYLTESAGKSDLKMIVTYLFLLVCAAEDICCVTMCQAGNGGNLFTRTPKPRSLKAFLIILLEFLLALDSNYIYVQS
jgi:hypothetical protein